jgi:Gametolysin peptidase M11
LQQQDPCTLIFQETQYWDDTPEPSRADTAGGRRLKKASPSKEKKQWVCELSEADAAAVDAKFVVVEGLDDDFIQANDIKSAETTILVEGESLAQDRMYVANTATTIVGEQKKIKVVKTENDGRRLSTGTRTVLVVRVSGTSDGRATSASASQLADDIFDDNVSLKSHYTACSYGKLTFQKATGNNIVNGVVSVNLNSNVAGVESGTVRDRMESAANSLVGTTVQSAYNHVMFCIPPGTVDSGSAGW